MGYGSVVLVAGERNQLYLLLPAAHGRFIGRVASMIILAVMMSS
jgi:hypothetical protein